MLALEDHLLESSQYMQVVHPFSLSEHVYLLYYCPMGYVVDIQITMLGVIQRNGEKCHYQQCSWEKQWEK